MLPKPWKRGMLALGVATALACAGCATGPDENNASFVSNAPSLESYQSAAAAAPTGYNPPVAYPSGKPALGGSCQTGGFS